MTQTPDKTALPRHILEAVHTACSEIPDAHPDDIADCVYGMLPMGDFDAHSEAIIALIGQYT